MMVGVALVMGTRDHVTVEVSAGDAALAVCGVGALMLPLAGDRVVMMLRRQATDSARPPLRRDVEISIVVASPSQISSRIAATADSTHDAHVLNESERGVGIRTAIADVRGGAGVEGPPEDCGEEQTREYQGQEYPCASTQESKASGQVSDSHSQTTTDEQQNGRAHPLYRLYKFCLLSFLQPDSISEEVGYQVSQRQKRVGYTYKFRDSHPEYQYLEQDVRSSVAI
mmetsp:Transcript_9460/g.13192  ORF Transcript_9460/g.13192 Transcript_9460/m.13192 type:complete len:227 (-) Transcript_9460:313-993(-)|eukprot:CAMPEP_0184488400 /NCGR_PEP_ID=MMETSP0113_2-20130426/11692_1 /TAXON_ID=91329 /ORGANISM="Norrisiella sphaerica, Strain BC52" /LENGTH=226 /DNA_ID=CAMNT_0026871133 /DNA_START=307 /DNA_END=987 /DNA_ORIENTATION=+